MRISFVGFSILPTKAYELFLDRLKSEPELQDVENEEEDLVIDRFVVPIN